jgi:L-alanine-DL-glutamate epimerase-like enolase superfamily enzyme
LWKAPQELAREAGELVERGFRRVKMRLGKSEDDDIQAVQSVRRAIGPSNDVMVDASMRYNLPLARRMAKVFENNNVFWFEEPFEPEEVDTYQQLSSTVGVPIAAGENEFGSQGFDELIRARAVDIVQPDASRAGGITEVVRVAKKAQDAGLRVAPHTWSDAVAIMANAQVVASMSNAVTVEVDQTANPFVMDLLSEPLTVRNGQLQLGNKPGLGLELNSDVIERYRLRDPLVIPDGCYSDMVFGKEWFRPFGPYVERT